VCYKCQQKGHVARFCPHSNVVRQSSQTASRSPGNVRRCYHCQSTQNFARFCTKANNSGDRDRSEAQATVRACFSDVRIAPAVSAFSRDFRTGARVDGLNVYVHSVVTRRPTHRCLLMAGQMNGSLANSRKSIQMPQTLSKRE